MSDEEDEEDSVDGDLVPAFLTMGVTASVLRAYHRIARMLRKAWTDMRFADDPVEEVEVAAVRCQPERIEDLCKATKFSRQELKFMYQGFKQVCPTGVVHENTFRDIYAQFFPQGDVSQYAHYLFQAFDQDHNGFCGGPVCAFSWCTRGEAPVGVPAVRPERRRHHLARRDDGHHRFHPQPGGRPPPHSPDQRGWGRCLLGGRLGKRGVGGRRSALRQGPRQQGLPEIGSQSRWSRDHR
ncbi:uncharacterized protein LOC144177875 isoform X2 [Haemaphysalis longicornis]